VEHLEVWYAQQRIDTIPRLRGEGKHRIQYRHIIDWLVRKPGAFENYRYREDLFPTHRFRMAYDWLKRAHPFRAAKEYNPDREGTTHQHWGRRNDHGLFGADPFTYSNHHRRG
jgi:hypothetical protein